MSSRNGALWGQMLVVCHLKWLVSSRIKLWFHLICGYMAMAILGHWPCPKHGLYYLSWMALSHWPKHFSPCSIIFAGRQRTENTKTTWLLHPIQPPFSSLHQIPLWNLEIPVWTGFPSRAAWRINASHWRPSARLCMSPLFILMMCPAEPRTSQHRPSK